MTGRPTLVCRPPRRHARRVITAIAAVTAFLAGQGVATADIQVNDPSNPGVSVTFVGIHSMEFVPGQVLELRGSGFFPINPGTGNPLVAIKPYDVDRAEWGHGGDDARTPDAISNHEALIWFEVHRNTGQWSGHVVVPSDITPEGPLMGPDAGTHWLRILSGAFATDSPFPNSGSVTVPITYKIPFTIREDLKLGLTGPSGFQTGTRFRAGAQLTPQSTVLPPNSAVTATLNGTPITVTVAGQAPGTPLVTDAAGALPATARVNLPVGVAPGTYTVAVTAGGESVQRTIIVTPPPTVTLTTPTAHPGGSFSFQGQSYIGVGGTGQKVAIVVNEQVLGCVQAAPNGSFTGSATLPPTTALGTVSVRFNAGTSCVQGGPVNDLPGFSFPTTLTVTDPPPPPADPPPPPPPPAKKPPVKAPNLTRARLNAKTNRLTLTLAGRTAPKTLVLVRTTTRVRVTPKGKPRVVVLATVRSNRVGAVQMTLTKDGKALMKRFKRIKVTVRITAPGRVMTNRQILLTRP